MALLLTEFQQPKCVFANCFSLRRCKLRQRGSTPQWVHASKVYQSGGKPIVILPVIEPTLVGNKQFAQRRVTRNFANGPGSSLSQEWIIVSK